METLFQTILRTSWQAAIVVGLVLAAQWIFRHRLSKAWRHSLWFLVMLRLVAPTLPESSFSLFNVSRLASTASPAEPVEPRRPAESGMLTAPGRLTAAEPAAPTLLPVDNAPVERAKPTMAEADTTTPRLNLWSVAAWIWLAGFTTALARILIGVALFSRRMRENRPIQDERFLRLFDECRQIAGSGKGVIAEESDAVESPALCGFLRPRLLLPSGLLDRFNDRELRFILLHELAHVRRGDVIVNWIASLLKLLHWFNPVLLLAFHRMKADRELACDELALSWTKEDNKQAYGETVIKLLERFASPAAAPGVIGIMESRSRMKHRLLMIAGFTQSRRWTVTAVTLLAVLSAVTLTEVKSETDDTPRDSTETQESSNDANEDPAVAETAAPDSNTKAKAEPEDPAHQQTNADSAAAWDWTRDKANMKRIFDAINRYRKDHDDAWPDFISTLVPRYLPNDASIWTCKGSPTQLPDPDLEVTYDYWFGLAPLPEDFLELSGYTQGDTARDMQTVMLERFGDATPVLQATRGNAALNLTMNGTFTETPPHLGWALEAPTLKPKPGQVKGRVRVRVEALPHQLVHSVVEGARIVSIQGDAKGLLPRTASITDSQGEASIPLLTENPLAVFLMAECDGYFPNDFSCEMGKSEMTEFLDDEAVISLAKLLPVGGIVVDESGAPIAGARVKAENGFGGEWILSRILSREKLRYEAVTGSDGRWEIKDLPFDARKIGFEVVHPDYGAARFGSKYGKGQALPSWPMIPFHHYLKKEAKLTLKNGFSIAGRTVDLQGKPIPNAKIKVQQPSGDAREFSSDNSGRFTLANLQTDDGPDAFANGVKRRRNKRTQIEISADGYAFYRKEFNDTKSLSDVIFQLDPASKLIAFAWEKGTRERISDVTVSLGDWRAQTDIDGRVEWDGAPVSGVYRFRKPGYYTLQKELTPEVSHAELTRTLVFKGTVRDADSGEALPAGTVTLQGWDAGRRPEEGFRRSGQVSNGRFELPDLDEPNSRGSGRPCDFYRLIFTVPGYAKHVVDDVRGAGGLSDFDIKLTKGRVLSGRIVAEGKNTQSSHIVVASTNSTTALQKGRFWIDQTVANDRADSRGRFELTTTLKHNRFYVAHPEFGFATIDIDTHKNGSKVELEPYGNLTARVTVNGAPFVGTLGLADAANRGFMLQSLNDPADKDGVVRIIRIPPGTYYATAYGEDFEKKLDLVIRIESDKTKELEINLDLRTIKSKAVIGDLDVDTDWSRHTILLRKTDSAILRSLPEGAKPVHHYGDWVPRYRGEPIEGYKFEKDGSFEIANALPGKHELTLVFRKEDEAVNKRYHLKTIVEIPTDAPGTMTLPDIPVTRAAVSEAAYPYPKQHRGPERR